MIIWCKLGTHGSQTMKVLRKRNAPKIGDKFDVIPSNEPNATPIPVRCFEIKMFGETPLYMLERF